MHTLALGNYNINDGDRAILRLEIAAGRLQEGAVKTPLKWD